ncbi:UNVERIFIED_CONTAM: hypothetical protein RMT77_009994 [Armadillidium vulgare]
MDCAGSENHNSSIENLKLFALSTHEELKSLHSRDLFKNFSNSQFEILLEDLKNCNYDENKWGIQKRVEWHILNSLNSTENEQYNNGLKNSEKSNEVRKSTNRRANLSPTHAALKKSPYTPPTHVANRGESFKKISDSKYERSKVWKSNKEQGRCDIQNQTQFCGHNLCTMKNNPRFGEKSMPYKSVNLEMMSIPHINILPLSKDTLPYISIEPSVSYNELPPKSRPISQLLRKKISSKLTNLEKIKNVSIDIPPLDKQKLQSINVPPCKSRTGNFVNQAVYEYKYEGMSSDGEINPVFVEPNHGKTYSNTRIKMSDTKIVNPTVSKNIDNDHYTNSRGHRVDNFDTDRFYGDRFIDRLEERLKSILPPPNKKFVAPKQSDRSVQVVAPKSDRSVQVVAPKSDLSVQVESIKPPFKGISLSEDSSTSGELKIPPPDFIKTSSETQTPYVFRADKFAQTSLIQDYNSETSVSSTCKENNVIDDQEQPQKLVEVSRPNGNRKRVAFDLDQFSPSENIVKKEDEDVDENSKQISSDASINSSTTTTNNNNNKETKDLKSDVMLRNEPTEAKSISNNEINSYDNKHKQNENSSKPCMNNTPTIKNIQQKPPLYIQDNVVEQETLQHSKGSPTVSNEEQSLYSLSFNSGSAENELPNEKVQTPERISNEEQQISSLSSISTKHEDRAEGEDTHHILKETKSYELESEEETVLPSIEIGDVTISEGEIEFEASIADVQPCNRIAIKISTKDLGMTTMMKDYCPDLANKETQTSLTHIENTLDMEATVCDSSFSEGFLLKSESKNQTKKNGLSTSSESYNETVQDVSEGELIGEVTPILDDEKQFLLIENEKLLKRLSGITGRFICR